jgi:hypothetical protein
MHFQKLMKNRIYEMNFIFLLSLKKFKWGKKSLSCTDGVLTIPMLFKLRAQCLPTLPHFPNYVCKTFVAQKIQWMLC